jgi:hypothetical protein
LCYWWIAIHYCVFWDVPFSCRRRDQHVLQNLHLFRTCHANLLIYIYSLRHICFWNHSCFMLYGSMCCVTNTPTSAKLRLIWQSNVLLFLFLCKMYTIINCLLIHDRNYHSKYFLLFVKRTIGNHWLDIDFYMITRSQTARRCTKLFCLKQKARTPVIDVISRLFSYSRRLAFLFVKDLKSSCSRCHLDFVNRYGIYVSPMTTNMFRFALSHFRSFLIHVLHFIK